MSPFQVRLLHPVKMEDAEQRPLLVYLPGTDGTGQAILPQVPNLIKAGFDVRCLYIPPSDRSSWSQLQSQLLYLLQEALQARPPHLRRATLVAESFGGCLGLRAALAAPQLFSSLVLLNPATSFGGSLGGLSSFVAATNLLALFPKDMYTTAQTVMMPLLADSDRVSRAGADALRSMLFMTPPFDFDEPGGGGAPGAAPDASSSYAYGSGGGGGGAPEPWGGGGAAQWGAGRNRGAPAAGGPWAPAGGGEGSLFAPAAAANFRANMLRDGNVPDADLARMRVPTLVVCSARDRMLPSLAEGARLARAIPGSRRVILPNSGHAALLERGIDLADILRDARMLPAARGAAAEEGAAAARAVGAPRTAAGAGGGDGSSGSNGNGGGGGGAGTAAAAANGAGGAATTSGGSSSISTAELRRSGGEGAAANGAAAAAAAASGAAPTGASGGTGEASPAGSRSASPAPAPAPPDADLSWDEWSQYLGPWRDLVSPVLLGTERLPDPSGAAAGRPIIFVGNHQRIGLYDMPLLMYLLYLRGFKPRGLAHPGHWAGPLGPFFERFGAVKAGPMTAFKLLKAGEQVLLFPGGAREVNKPRGSEYTLAWPDDRPDFVRLAGKTNAIIVPFAAVGADDAYDVMMDVDEVLQAPVLGSLATAALQRWAPGLDPREALLPVTRLPGLGLPIPALVPLPNLQRLYFKILDPIDTAELGLGSKDAEGWQRVYDEIRASVEGGMQELLELRSTDGDRDVDKRVSKAPARAAFKAAGADPMPRADAAAAAPPPPAPEGEQDGPKQRVPQPADALMWQPEFRALLATHPDGPAAFALAAHGRLLAAAQAQLAAAGGAAEALRPARTAFSDGGGRFVRRGAGSMVMHAQTLAGGGLVDWGHQSFGLGPYGLYSKTSLWLRAGAGSLVPLTPHLELEMFAPLAAAAPLPDKAAAAAGGAAAPAGAEAAEGGGRGGGAPILFYLNLVPRASLALYPAYVDRYYTSPPPACTAAAAVTQTGGGGGGSWAALEAACAGSALFERFVSPSLHVRAFSSTAILFNVDSGPEGRAAMLDAIEGAAAIWGGWLAADRAASLDALCGTPPPPPTHTAAPAPACAAAAAAAAGLSVGHPALMAAATAAAAASGWLLAGAPAAAGGLGAALLAEAPALDAGWRRFPRREPAAAALSKAFGDDAMEAWWSSVDGSARVG
ncbi:MAG: hypothetical protein J3K34DRAFT_472042 [Monoraphidium minutum]|nr:MAG: hypothetical protein J3K34DRAFT_472042 [Monoraphidium minutum]